jgi:acetylornithine deacetylase/succinyl-diaminopimelate desuccinylase-like protein
MILRLLLATALAAPAASHLPVFAHADTAAAIPSQPLPALQAPLVSLQGAPIPGEDPEARLRQALQDSSVRQGLEALRARGPAAAELLVEIGGIVSPSGEELERARRVAEEMEVMGLQDVRVDGSPNAVGVIPGRSGSAVVFISTLDDLATVAAHQRAAEGGPMVEDGRVVGPGTNTSSITVSMLEAARAYLETGLEPEHDLIFAAVAQEETGLRGMRALVEELGDRAVAYVDILGDGRSISYGGLAIHWWRVRGEGPPGHSLGGGLPNVNQGLARAVDRILTRSAEWQDPEERTILNVAIMESGAVFNHKPAEGWFSLDLRSLDLSRVHEMEAAVGGILAEVSEETGVVLRLEEEQQMPGGQIPGALESGLVRSSVAVARSMELEPSLSPAGSSNLNVAVAAGIPAIGLGGSRGGARGDPEEWADVSAMMGAAEHVYLLSVLLAGVPGRLEATVP